MEEKVQYQSDERLQDVNEVLENCQTRVSFNEKKTPSAIKELYNFQINFFNK